VRVDDVDSEIDRLLSKLQGLSSKRKPILHLILEGDSARRAVAQEETLETGGVCGLLQGL